MTLACLGRVGRLLGPAVLLAIGCAPARIVDDGDADTGSSSADDGGASSGGGSSSGGSSSGGSSSDGTGTNGSSGSSTSTGTPPLPCGPLQLGDIAAGIGGFAMDGEAAHDVSGQSVSGAGDFNGDGLADVVVGAPGALEDDDWGTGTGRTYVVFGRADTAAISLADVAQGIGGFAMDGEAAGDWSGESVNELGDFNGDGLADVVVGARFADPNDLERSGRTYVVFGKASTEAVALADVAQGIGGFAMDGETEADYSGSSVSGAGDVNGDGLADLVVGAAWADPNGIDWSGRTYVVFGKADTDEVSLADVAQGVGGFVLDGEAERDGSGRAVSGAGDVNGDGLADVVVGAPYADPNGNLSGRAYVVFGKTDTDPLLLADIAEGIGGFALDGEAERDLAGASVSEAGDVNGDGRADVLVGAYQASPNGTYSGRTYVVFGKADTDRVSLAEVAQGIGGFALDGEESGDSAGWSVSDLGDINDDGLADVIVGALWAEPNGPHSGRTYVVFGKTDTDEVLLADVVLGIGGFALDGEAATDLSGQSVSKAGDVNHDGIPDFLVGAPAWYSEPGDPHVSGRTYVVFGGDFSCGGGR